MKRIFLLDTYYQDFISTLPRPITGTYATELRKVLDRGFGTADFYSHYLKAEGWDCCDSIANYELLQGRWAMEYRGWQSGSLKAIALEQVAEFKPDCLFLQDMSFFDAATLDGLSRKYLLAGQISCPMPKAENVSKLDVCFTSFPHYVDRIKAMGVPAVEYLPLAFDPRMLSEESPKKQFDISFVGGVGKQSHWKAGTEMLEAVARAFPDQLNCFIYGRENLAKDSPLHGVSGPSVFGRDMYAIYGRSKIVVNRHGEVAAGYSNNLRMYEATGMGALLFTEESKNLGDIFPDDSVVAYTPETLIGDLRKTLGDHDRSEHTARRGQDETLQRHTYANRMKVVSEVLTHALEKVAA